MSWKEVNGMLFEAEDVKAGKHIDFIKSLLALDLKDEYVDMHVRNEDMGCVSVGWTVEPWGREYGGHWQYIRDDLEERVVRSVGLPDGSSMDVDANEPDEKAIHEWLKEHKDEGWEKDWLGHWRSAADRKRDGEFMKSFIGEGAHDEHHGPYDPTDAPANAACKDEGPTTNTDEDEGEEGEDGE